MFWTFEAVFKLRNLRKLHILRLRARSVICKKKQTEFPRGRDDVRKARSNFTASQIDQSEALSLFQPTTNKRKSLAQGSPELFSPSVMRKREELWGRECRALFSPSVMRKREELWGRECSGAASGLCIFVICLSISKDSRDSVPIEEVTNCLVEVNMATASEKVKTEEIDLVLRDAQVCNHQLNFLLYHLLNEPNVDEERSAEIESKCATIFRDMMSNLYSVLDQIYYFLYCHFRNDGNVSYSNAAFRIKQPIKQDLKWSEDDTRDGQRECKKRRNDWVAEQCNTIFGGFNFPESKRIVVRNFQNNLLQLQAIRKVDQSGHEVLGPNGEPTLLRVVSIEHNAQGNLSQFNPSSLEVEELRSVADTQLWNETIMFNLLHFFRNFTAHRSLIACKIKEGYLNLETREFKSADPNSSLSYPWILIAKGSWILVPELSHLRQAGRVIPPTFHHS